MTLVTEFSEQYTTNNGINTTVAFNQKLRKTQKRTLTFSLLWSALGFIAVALLTFGYVYVFKKYFYEIFYYHYNTYTIVSSVVTIVLFVIGIILDMKVRTNLLNASWGLIISVWFIYVLLYTGMLAPLITLIDDPYVIAIGVGITGASLLLCTLISLFWMNDKAAYTINKIITILFIVIMLMQLIFIIPFALLYAYQTWQIIYSVVFSVVSFLMLLQNMFSISRTASFVDTEDNATITKLSFYFGYIIMCSVVRLFIILLNLLLVTRR